jgi:hypothetical protein
MIVFTFSSNATLRFHIADAGFFHVSAAARQLTPADAYYATDCRRQTPAFAMPPCRYAASFVRFLSLSLAEYSPFSPIFCAVTLICRYFSSDAAAMRSHGAMPPPTRFSSGFADCRRRRRFHIDAIFFADSFQPFSPPPILPP